jgi:hypothetical protein
MSAVSARQRTRLRASRVARAAASSGGGRQLRHRSTQNSASRSRTRPWARERRERTRRWAAGERDGAVQHRLADDALDLQCPAVADRRGQARAQRVQLVVQSLLGDLALGD